MSQEMYTTNPACCGAVFMVGAAWAVAQPEVPSTIPFYVSWAAGAFFVGLGWWGAYGIRQVDTASMVMVAVIGLVACGVGGLVAWGGSLGFFQVASGVAGAAVVIATLVTVFGKRGCKSTEDSAHSDDSPLS